MLKQQKGPLKKLAYVAAGADMIFAEAISDLKDFKKFCEQNPNTDANMTEFGKTPLYADSEFAEANYL